MTSNNHLVIRQLTHTEVPRQARSYPITLLLPDWTNPRNVGAAFRLADAAGLNGIVLAGSTPRPPNSKIGKTARSTVRTVPYTEVADPLTYLRAAREREAYILSLEFADNSQSLFDFAPPAGEIILIAGNESVGISEDLLSLSNAAVHLPMHGQNTSMNVSVAVGAAVYLLLMKLQ
ncbi:TrmH family RNA methyltransferase [Lewinella sp. IMCC34191]|uniref:TrmH family RNA methyltransferase n=1 Tax=Lewinella sp. IMCC34191 TaxID=2259172 RepID=UPI000E24681C|nr:TrmH family RNA methyltransferase [Lewinella sp. IMCC34191]